MIAMNFKNKLRAITIAILFVALPFLGKAQHFIGIKEGVTISSVSFTPKQRDSSTVQWLNVGIVYKYYNSPWVGFQTGLNYAEKGFVWNDTTRRYKVLELPLLSQFHYEAWHLRFIINAGMYASYALSVDKSYKVDGVVKKDNSFTERDRRLEYGLHIGGGFGIIFKPFELQFEAGYQFAFSYMMAPHHANEQFIYTHFNHWRFSVALLFQL